MADTVFLVNIDANQNQIKNVALQSLGTAPSSPVQGQFYLDTSATKQIPKVWRSNASGTLGWHTMGGIEALASGTGMGTFTESDGTVTVNAAQDISTTAEPTFRQISLTYPPSLSSEVATKGYVDSLSQGVKWKNSVILMTTDSLPAIVIGEGGITFPVIQSITVTPNDRVLVINGSSPNNGIWQWKEDYPGHTLWYRSADCNTWDSIVSATVMVEEGTYADTAFVCTADPGGTIDITNMPWVKMSKAIGTVDLTTSVTGTLPTGNGGTGFASYSAGDLLYGALSGGGLSKLANGSLGQILFCGGSGVGPSWANPSLAGITSKFATNCSTATSQTITHNLGTTDVQVQVWETSGSKRQVYTEVRIVDSNSITVIFNVAPTSSQYRIVVVG